LAWAEAGFKVFPLRPGSKDGQVLRSWKEEATTDPATIGRWWDEEDYNVACRIEEGHAVVDTDSMEGHQAWLDFGGPPTFSVRTPRGGYHRHLNGNLPNSVKEFGPGFDTRGCINDRAGYVLLPGSIIEGIGEYTVSSPPGWEFCFADVPPALARKVAEYVARRVSNSRATAPAHIEPSEALFAAREWLKTQPVPVANDRDTPTFILMAGLRDRGMDYWQRQSLIRETGNEIADEDLTRINKSIEGGNVQNEEPGTKASPPLEEVFAHVKPSTTPRASTWHIKGEDEQELTPRPSWLVPGLIPEGGTVVLYSGRGAGKTLAALDLALSVSTGLETIFGMKPVRAGVVIYAALEGLRGIESVRRRAWKLERGITGKIENFFTCRAPRLKYPDQVRQFVEQLRAQFADRKIELIVLDTMAKIMTGLDSVRDAGLFNDFTENLAVEFGCAVLTLGHVGKGKDKSLRGGAELIDGAGSEIFLEGDHKGSHTMKVTVLHHKDNELPGAPFYFVSEHKHESIILHPSDREEYAKRKMGGKAMEKVSSPKIELE
jgi:hypothetical protein